MTASGKRTPDLGRRRRAYCWCAKQGGFVTDFRGADRALETGQVLAANDQLHSKLHKLSAGALRADRAARTCVKLPFSSVAVAASLA
jgi:hypothetical protein